MKKIGIIGASGYVGQELLRLLASHPDIEIAFVTSQNHVGNLVSSLNPVLARIPKFKTMRFCVLDLQELPMVDLIFLTLPNGKLPKIVSILQKKNAILMNLAGDYRLDDRQLLQSHYPESLHYPAPQFDYFIPEFSEITGSYFNLPGCMAVAVIYGLFPLCKNHWIVIADVKSSSSGAGISAQEAHAERSKNFRVYMLHGHRHEPEIVCAMKKFTEEAIKLNFSTYSLDSPRGIFASIYCRLKLGITKVDVQKVFFSEYRNKPFVNFLPNGYPMLKTLIGTNYVDIGYSVEGQSCVVVVALDNLVKGASGQAVQAMNKIFKYEETLALKGDGLWP